jgi:heme A synthase
MSAARAGAPAPTRPGSTKEADGPRPTSRGLRRLSWTAVAAVFLLMGLGNVVSATGSGLACPDWPLCHGRVIPPLRADVLIEWSHRLAAAVTSVLLVVTIALATRRAAGRARRVGVALLGLLAVQILLGGATVLLRLPHLLSTAHLVNALLILAGLLWLIHRTRGDEPSRTRGPAAPTRLVLAVAAVLLLQLALGGYVRHAGAGLACPDFPLCSGDVLPGHWLATVHWIHRWLGVLLLGAVVHLALRARRTPLGRQTALVAALAGVQVALGVAAVLLRLEPPVRAAHAAVGYLTWALVVWTALRVRPGAERHAAAPVRSQREAPDAA